MCVLRCPAAGAWHRCGQQLPRCPRWGCPVVPQDHRLGYSLHHNPCPHHTLCCPSAIHGTPIRCCSGDIEKAAGNAYAKHQLDSHEEDVDKESFVCGASFMEEAKKVESADTDATPSDDVVLVEEEVGSTSDTSKTSIQEVPFDTCPSVHDIKSERSRSGSEPNAVPVVTAISAATPYDDINESPTEEEFVFKRPASQPKASPPTKPSTPKVVAAVADVEEMDLDIKNPSEYSAESEGRQEAFDMNDMDAVEMEPANDAPLPINDDRFASDTSNTNNNDAINMLALPSRHNGDSPHYYEQADLDDEERQHF
eukprot:GDKJ01041076.1.p1 GENE.GDKJ01041076.1~~GDKJ01041076.1.p1  ORF type:complete len:311 (+),score=24.64 GDKJ01041076.1:383-1315(+)